MSGDVSLGGRFRLTSGNPATIYVDSYRDLDSEQYLGKAAGGESRLPTFHQLDLRVDYKVAFDSWLLGTYLDVINVYNQHNPEFLIWDYRYKTSTPVSIIPLLPVAGVKAEF